MNCRKMLSGRVVERVGNLFWPYLDVGRRAWSESDPPSSITRHGRASIVSASINKLSSDFTQRLALYIKAELENVTGLEPASDDFDWFFKVRISSYQLAARHLTH